MKYNHNTDIYISFYNDRILEAIPASEIAEPFTYVPIKAGHQELVGGNVMVFGNMTEGYPIQEVDCDIELNSESLIPLDADLNIRIDSWRIAPPTLNDKIYWILVIHLPSKVYVGATYVIKIKDPLWATAKEVTYVSQPGDTVFLIQVILMGLLSSAGITLANNETGYSNVICIEKREQQWHNSFSLEENGYLDPPPHIGWYLYGRISTGSYGSKFPQLKRGSKHGFGIVYKDDCGRQNSVAKTDNMILNIPFYDEIIYYGDAIGSEWMDSGVSTKVNPTFKIYHKPPSWAKYYEIVYCGNLSMDSWLQIRAYAIYDMSNNQYRIDIQSAIDEIRNKNTRWKLADWDWQEGDRLRLVGTINTTTGEFTEYDDLYDYGIDILYEGVVGGDFVFQAVDKPTPFTASNSNIVIEVYRPKKGMGTSVFYGGGMVFEIGTDANGRKYHKGNVDQEFDENGFLISPAEVINTSFDSFKFQRLNFKPTDPNTIHPFWAESNLPSDWWADQILVNRLTSQGFPFLYDISQKQSTLAKRLRHGGYLIPGTQINDIAHFTYEDFIDMAEKDGDITGLREIGYTLKVLQFHKETSIYINRIQTFNPDGTEQFTLVDRLLGTVRPEETIFGTQHPDSVLIEGRNLYYWDNIEAEVIRSSPNGQVAISGPEYKVSRWFKDLGKWIRENGGSDKLKVRFGFNVDHDELWCTFIIDETVYGIVFSEAQKRWITRINNNTDAYVHAGEFFAHLYNQKMWVMNVDQGQDYLSWGGVQVDGEIEFVSNIDPKKNKVFNAIAVYSDHEMEIPSGYIRIPAEASSSLMESFVAIWEEKEGIFYGAILKDLNTPGVWVNDDDVSMNGREMRGRYCFVKMKTSIHTEKVRLDSVIVFSTPSERNV